MAGGGVAALTGGFVADDGVVEAGGFAVGKFDGAAGVVVGKLAGAATGACALPGNGGKLRKTRKKAHNIEAISVKMRTDETVVV